MLSNEKIGAGSGKWENTCKSANELLLKKWGIPNIKWCRQQAACPFWKADTWERKGGKQVHMRCPYCNQDNTRVVDSRPVEETNSIRRRRLCDSCGRRFTTYENVEIIPLTVIKKNLNREQYDRNKLINGIRRACYKRPIASEKLEAMIDAVEGDIFDTEEKEISSTKIGEIVMSHLKDLDSVAYVRFASVYREFKDVSTFMDELKKFMN